MPPPPLHSTDVKTPGAAARQIARRPSLWLIGAIGAAALAARLLIGDFGWPDLIVPALLLAVYPFGEWAIHVYLLHLPPFRWRGREVELVTAKGHRRHHERPDNLRVVLLEWPDVLGLLGLAVPLVSLALAGVVAALGGGFHPPALLSALALGALLVALYEWTHFLIHTAHRPRTRLFRAIWRTHRLHHFKNEHYWHGVTSTVADRVLGTAPDHRTVERSPTARSLRGRTSSLSSSDRKLRGTK
jgi:hypothetical protein